MRTLLQSLRSRAKRLAKYGPKVSSLVAVTSLLCAGCAGDFDPASAVHTVRVLGVKKDKPYAKPGDTVQLEMLAWDGKPGDTPRPLIVAWLGGCENPAGDLYYGCFPQFPQILAAAAANGGALSAPVLAPYGPNPKSSVRISSDIITRRPPPEKGITPYGLAEVFFAVCSGTKFDVAPPSDESANALPLVCLDAAGKPLGQDDFVIGYTSIYVYDERTNANPQIDELDIDKKAQPVINDAPLEVNRCVTPDCTKLELKALTDPNKVEIDPEGIGLSGEKLTEQMWVAYYATRGHIDTDLRLINDASKGFNTDSATDWTPPPVPGLVRLAAVVHDSRGGVDWRERLILVK